MLDNNISLKSIFVDQVITGFENQTMNREQFLNGRNKYDHSEDVKETKGQRLRLNIELSLHYKYLLDRNSYLSAYRNYVKVSNQTEDHSSEKFDQLAREFSLEILRENPIILNYIGDGEYQVIDGFHRLAIYLWKTKNRHIPFEFVTGIQKKEIELGKPYTSNLLTRKLRKVHNQGFYNSWAIGTEFQAGYHGFDILGFRLKGQRNNLQRVTHINTQMSLNDRRILDLGCNSGGFILHIPVVEFALGMDFDKKSISFAKFLIKNLEKVNPELSNRYHFKCTDIDKISVAELTDTIIRNSINLVCLLSMGSWLSNWELIYSTVACAGVDILLETNNDEQGISELSLLRDFGYTIKLVSNESSDDNTGNFGRKTYICSRIQTSNLQNIQE